MTFYGGAEVVIVRLLNYLTKKGIESTLLTMNIAPEIRREIKGSGVVVLKKSFLTGHGVPYSLTIFPTVYALTKYLKRNEKKFDVINVHNFPAEMVTAFTEKRVVWMCNEPPQLNFAGPSIIEKSIGEAIVKIEKLVAKNIDCVVVADDFNAERFERIYKKKPEVVPYGVDCDLFEGGNAERARRKFGLKKDEFTMVQVGMITPFKNQMESVRATASLKKEIPKIKLVLAGKGEGDYEEALKKKIKTLGLEKNVIFTGHVSRADVRDIYAASDVAVFPVRLQGGWLSPFEALCAEVPIVVSKEMTAQEFIANNKIGIVTDDFHGAVLKVREDPAKYRKMAKLGHAWVKKNLTWDKFCERMVECFQKGEPRP